MFIFIQILVLAVSDQESSLFISIKYFLIISQVASINDKQDFRAVMDAMKATGFSEIEMSTTWKLVASVLHLVSAT